MSFTPKRQKTSDFLNETKKLAELIEEQNRLEIDHCNQIEELNKRFLIEKNHTAAKIKKSQKRLRDVYDLNLDTNNDLPKIDPYARYKAKSSVPNTPAVNSRIGL